MGESKLIKKEQEIHNIYKTQKELQLLEKDNKIRAISKTHKILQAKLIEKEKKIYDFNKTESKLIEKENEIRDLENKIQKYKKLKSEQNKTHQEKIKLIHIDNRSKLSNLRNKHWEEIEKSKENLKLLEKEKRIGNQELLKSQKLNEKLVFENVHLKKKETFL